MIVLELLQDRVVTKTNTFSQLDFHCRKQIKTTVGQL